MKIIFNCVVNRMGGAIQNAANFILLAMSDTEHNYQFLVSSQVYILLREWGKIDGRVHKLDHPLSNRKTQDYVNELEEQFNPDLIYTMAGPTYLKFKTIHVLGLSDGYITHAKSSDFFYQRSIKDATIHFLKSLYKGFRSRIEGDYFIFQTEAAKAGYISRYKLPNKISYVVHNAVGASFSQCFLETVSNITAKNRDEFTILIPAADYPHKDIFIVERIATVLKKMDFSLNKQLKFIVTIQETDFNVRRIDKINKASEVIKIKNIGPYSYNDAFKIYSHSDMVFIPSILETFSSSYLEAIAMGKPLLVADKLFSREVCGEAAIYFQARNEYDALIKIKKIMDYEVVLDQADARQVLSRYGSYEQRYQNILGVMQEIKRKNIK